MGRRLKLVLAALGVVVALLVANAIYISGKTRSAEVTVPGGRVLALDGGDMQVAESGRPDGPPIVLVHCFSCAMDWWEAMLPPLEEEHRVVRVDLLGHGGSEKPDSGYTPPNQAEAVAEALRELDVRDATVVGHSLGGSVSVALAEAAPKLVDRVAIVDMPPDRSYGDLGFIAGLAFRPVLGEFLWAIKPDFSVRDGLEVAFAPGYEIPDAFIEDVKRLTYSAYDGSPTGNEDFLDERSLDLRMKDVGKPLMVLMGAEEQIVDDPERALAQFGRSVPAAQLHLIAGAGHSPNVEKPAQTADLVLKFANPPQNHVGSPARGGSGRGQAPKRNPESPSTEDASGVRSATGNQ